MTFPTNASQQFESYVPVYDVIPANWEDARQFLTEMLKRYGNGINQREMGFFIDDEVLAGKFFIPTAAMSQGKQSTNSQQFRSVFRTVVNFGALPNAGLKTAPHNITFDSNFSLVNLWLAATDPVNLLAFGLSYWANSQAGSIILNMDSSTVRVTTTSNYSTYTRCFIVIEYIQEV